MTEIWKTVSRSWRERLLSLKPHIATKQVRDIRAETIALLLEADRAWIQRGRKGPQPSIAVLSSQQECDERAAEKRAGR